MGSSVVEVGDVFLHHPVEMPLAEQDEEVETLSSQTAPKAFADGIGLRGTVGSQQNVDASDFHYAPEQLPEFAIPISNEKARTLPVRRSFAELLSQARITRGRGRLRCPTMNLARRVRNLPSIVAVYEASELRWVLRGSVILGQ